MTERVIEQREIKIIIPQCCRENWDTCIHVIPKPKKKKRNIGM